MHSKRKSRLLLVVFVLAGLGTAVGFTLLALEQNIDLFYPPAEIVDGTAPVGERIRAGGMVAAGSVRRGDGLAVSFVLTDLQGAEFEVGYTGILPDLFREGQGILATGRLNDSGRFEAEQVLAKHDENYMPPELAEMMPHTEGAPAPARPGLPM